MKKIIPAILTDNLEDLQAKVKLVEGFAEWIQIDFMDGQFVDNDSVSVLTLTEVQTKAKLEAHLMVEKPENYFADCAEAGIKRVIFHIEACRDIENILKKAARYDFEIGVAVNPETPIGMLTPILDKIDLVLFLGVNPGWQGQDFIPEVIDKIKELRPIAKDKILEVDGGVKLDNVAELSRAGIDYFVVGSGLLKSDDIQKTYREFMQEVGT